MACCACAPATLREGEPIPHGAARGGEETGVDITPVDLSLVAVVYHQ